MKSLAIGLFLAACHSTLHAAQSVTTNDVRLILPKVVWAAVGVEANIYFANATLIAPENRSHEFVVTCGKGKADAVRWTLTPTAADVGDAPLKLEVRDAAKKVVATASTTVRVARVDAGQGKPLRYLPIGDSLTEPGVYTRKLLQLCARPGNPALTLLGTNASTYGGVAGNVHEGYSGWKCDTFLTKYNPAFDPKGQPKKAGNSPFIFLEGGKPVFNMARYITEHCQGTPPDVATIFLGGNDNAALKPETVEKGADEFFANIEKVLAALRATSPKMVLGVVTMVPDATVPEAAGASAAAKQQLWDYRKIQHRVVERTYEHFGNREREKIFVIPAYLNLDATNHFPWEKVKLNAALSFYYGLHPKDEGYLQFGDTLYAWLKNVAP